MKRFHALEWEDLTWFPTAWRDYGTDYLRFVASNFDIYRPVLPVLKKGIEAGNNRHWVDYASGGGSALVKLAEKLQPEYPDLKITLTDYFPNLKAFERIQAEGGSVFEYETASVDATNPPPHLRGKLMTLFGSFHHFRPEQAQKILQNAVDSNSPIVIIEPVGRNAASFISMLSVFFNVLLFTPFIRPVRWGVFPFIYLIPLIPLYIFWDGIASIFRTYSEKELRELVAGLHHGDHFEWEIGHHPQGHAMPVYYLLGTPKKPNYGMD